MDTNEQKLSERDARKVNGGTEQYVACKFCGAKMPLSEYPLHLNSVHELVSMGPEIQGPDLG